MSNVFTTFSILLLFIVCLFVGVYAIGELRAANTAGCAFDENGTLLNCTYSDYAYGMQNKTANMAGELNTSGSYLIYVLVGLVLISVFIFLGSRIRL
jgi:hypothetical protein